MPKTSDNVLGRRFFALFVGLTGSGKTLAGASWPGLLEFIDFDDRMDAVKMYLPARTNINFDKFNLTNFEEFAYKFIPRLTKDCPYSMVQLAGITSLTHLAITYQMHQMSGGDNLKKTKGGLMVPSWDQFNGEAMIVGQVLDALKSLPCSVIVEAHPVSRINSVTNEKYTSLAAFGPKVESIIPGYFNEVYFFKIEKSIDGSVKHVCYTRPTEEYPLAKTTLPIKSKYTMTDDNGQPLSLYDLIQADLTEHQVKLAGQE